MTPIRKLTFASAVNDREIFNNNFLISPIFAAPHSHQIIVQSGFTSAANAYNDAIARSENEIIVLCHQDMIFPATWLSDLERALTDLESADPNWGVLGCFGETVNAEGRGYVYMPGLGTLGSATESPTPVQTLDEIVLIIKKSSGLRFDPTLPHFHFYGTDICLRAAEAGMKAYAISAFCLHNTQYNLVLPPEFYACYRHIKKRWKQFLPIQTTCVRITQFDVDMNMRRLREYYLRTFRGQKVGAVRFQNAYQLLEEFGERNGAQLEASVAGDREL
jgi:Glycosyltransferase like family